jgi:hypothetical protein
MSEEIFVEVKLEELTKRNARVRCQVCKKDSQSVEIIASVKKHVQAEVDRRLYVDWWDTYQTLKCGGCETVFFRVISSNSEDVDYDWDQDGNEVGRYNTVERFYPEIENLRDEINGFDLLPSHLAAVYTEAAKALNSNQPVLAGIGIRAILETICKDKCAPGSNLYEKIDGLKSQGVLSPNGAEVLHKLRVLGNTSAHEVKPQSSDQLLLAFDVLDNLLSNVYVLEPSVKKIFP